jgi:two-component system chemotaxis response regulator CheY
LIAGGLPQSLQVKKRRINMKILIVEDDFTSRFLMQKLLSGYGETHVAIDGKEALAAFQLSLEEKQPYDLIFLDIMMPKMDGHEVLGKIRKIEETSGTRTANHVKIVMTTVLSDSKNIMTAFKAQCDGYLTKPIDKDKLVGQINSLGLLT